MKDTIHTFPVNAAGLDRRPGAIGAPFARHRRTPTFDLFRASQRLDGTTNPVGRLFYSLNQNDRSVSEARQ
ncbi:MAG: hypothetical protein ACR2QV_05380 [Gammaproteobacteria bacterium]